MFIKGVRINVALLLIFMLISPVGETLGRADEPYIPALQSTNDTCLSNRSQDICRRIKFDSCSSLIRRWPFGVAASSWSRSKYASQAKVSSLGYANNYSLDLDQDGIACEHPADFGSGGRCPWLNRTERRYFSRWDKVCEPTRKVP